MAWQPRPRPALGVCCGRLAAARLPFMSLHMWQRNMGKKLNRPIHPIFLEDNVKQRKTTQTKREKKLKKPFSLRAGSFRAGTEQDKALGGTGGAKLHSLPREG